MSLLPDQIDTSRCNLKRVRPSVDGEFLLRLVNEPTWIQYIGDRNIRTLESAQIYATKLESDFNQRSYGAYILRLNNDNDDTDAVVPVGLVGFFKRDYLSAPDLGFALLADYHRRGLCFEACVKVLDAYKEEKPDAEYVYGLTSFENDASQNLLLKLGFEYVEANEESYIYKFTFHKKNEQQQ